MLPFYTVITVTARLYLFQGKSGLFALLPPPQHASIKETNRALIPHTLTKKQPAAPAPKPSTQPSKKEVVGPAKPSQEDSDSDGEDQPSNFFSFGDNDTHTVSGLSSKKLSLPPPMVASEHLVSGVVRPSVNVSQDLAGGSVLGRSVDPQSGALQFRASYSSTQGVCQPHMAGPIPMETSMAAEEIEQGSDETEVSTYVTLPFPPLYNLTALFKCLRCKFAVMYLIIKDFFSVLGYLNILIHGIKIHVMICTKKKTIL